MKAILICEGMTRKELINAIRSRLAPEEPDYCCKIGDKFYTMDNVDTSWPWRPIDPAKHGQPKRPINGTHQVIRITPNFEIYF